MNNISSLKGKICGILILLAIALPAYSLDINNQNTGFNNSLTKDKNTNYLNEKLNSLVDKLEVQSYGKNYSQENIYTRVSRLENSTFRQTYSNLSINQRINNLVNQNQLAVKKKNDSNKNTMLELMESKYFGNSHSYQTMSVRITNLENILFGMTYNNLDIDTRYNNLIQSAPLSITGVRLSESSGYNISVKPDYYVNTTANQLPPDYFSSCSSPVIKWNKKPVKVYKDKSLSYSDAAAIIKSVSEWKKYISITTTENINEADIIINFKSSNTMVTYVENKAYINISSSINKYYLSNILLHELGHALGINGHSDNKSDVMYNYKELQDDLGVSPIKEKQDFLSRPKISDMPFILNKRDVNTLIKIYGRN